MNLDMTQVVERQVRSVLTQFKNEMQRMAGETATGMRQIGESAKQSGTQIEQLVNTTRKLHKDGSITETRRGYDDLKQSIVEVRKNSELLSRSVKTDSDTTKGIREANELYKAQVTQLQRLYALKTQRLGAADGSAKANGLDAEIGSVDALIEKTQTRIGLLDKEVVAQSNLSRLRERETTIVQRYQSALERQQAAQAGGRQEITHTQQALAQLTTAYRNYNASVQNRDQVGMNYWQQNAASAMAEIQGMERKLQMLGIEEGARTKILQLIEQAKTAEQTQQRTLRNMGSLQKMLDGIGTRMLQMAATMMVMRTLTRIWTEARNYAAQYYDQLNEIRIVTGISIQEANR